MSEKIKVHVFHCGEVGVDPAVPFRDVSKNPIAYTGLFRSKKLRIWLPVSAYLIEHPKGLILIDTGWSSDVREKPIKHMTFRLYGASKPVLPKGQAVNEQLLKLGIKTKELDYVFISHMDADHVSGLNLVKDAKRILVSEEEFNSVMKGNIRYSKNFFKGINIKTFKMEDSQYGPFKKAFDVFDDGTVLMIDAKGHSAGNVITMIRNDEKFILLTADCGYSKDSWEKMRLPGPVYDKENMLTSLKWVNTMAKKKNCLGVLANHDPNIKPEVIEL